MKYPEDKILSGIIEIVAHNLNELLKIHSDNGYQDTYFDAIEKPAITIEDYLKRIAKHSSPPICAHEIIGGLILIDRYCKHANISLTYYNVHRLIAISLGLMGKFDNDHPSNMPHLTKVAGLSNTDEFIRLELAFLITVDFDVAIRRDEYTLYRGEIVKQLQKKWPMIPPPPYPARSNSSLPAPSINMADFDDPEPEAPPPSYAASRCHSAPRISVPSHLSFYGLESEISDDEAEDEPLEYVNTPKRRLVLPPRKF